LRNGQKNAISNTGSLLLLYTVVVLAVAVSVALLLLLLLLSMLASLMAVIPGKPFLDH
jgi:hypothetical protein